MSTAEVDELSAEIRKIVLAPYAVCLKPLHNLLRQHDSAAISDWAETHEDEISRFAAALVQGLALWPYTLDIIRLIAPAVSIRDAILEESPSLLNHLLDMALTQSDEEKVSTAICISFLSEPLPAGLPLPAPAQTFLSQLFESAMERPSIPSIRPVYLLLDGACSDLLELLPQSGLDGLRDQLTTMMKTARKIEEQPLSLYCLAIIAKLNKFHHVVGEHAGRRPSVMFTPSSQRTKDMSSHSWAEVQKFFQGERALKTIHLLILQVIYACRTDSKDSALAAAENVRIAREVLSAVDMPARGKFVQSNNAIVKKLQEKAANRALPQLLQLEAVAFSATLQLIPAQMQVASTVLLDSLIDLGKWRLQDRRLSNSLEMALPLAAAQMDQRFWKNLLTGICCVISERDNIHAKQTAAGMLQLVTSVVRSQDLARDALVLAIDNPQLRRMLEEGMKGNAQESRGKPTREHQSTVKVAVELCTFIIEVGANQTLSSLTSLATRKLRNLAITSSVSAPVQPWHAAPISLMEQSCTPEEQAASHNWQQRLAMELNIDSRHRQESVARLIGQVCRDLQERCDNVEKPLRLQEAKYEDLKTASSKTQAQLQEAKDHLASQAAEVDMLRRSKAQLQEDLEATGAECDAIMQEKENSEKSLRRSHAEDMQAMETSKRELEARNLELKTTLACNEEVQDEQAQEISRLKQRLSELERVSINERQQAVEEKEALTEFLALSDNRAQQAEAIRNEQTSQIHNLQQQIGSLESSLATLSEESTQLRAESTAHISSLTTANTALTTELSTLRTQHETALSAASTELSAMRLNLITQLEAAQLQYSTLHAQNSVEFEAKDATIAALQQKAQKYLEQCHRKTQELEEAQRMRGRLLMAMGLDTKPDAGNSKKRRSSRRERTSLAAPPQLMQQVSQATEGDFDETEYPGTYMQQATQRSPVQSQEEADFGSTSPFDSPLASLGNIQSQRPQARARGPAAFKVPLMKPPSESARGLKSPPRRRQSARAMPLVDRGAEGVNRDLRSPRRVQSEKMAVGMGPRAGESVRKKEICLIEDGYDRGGS